MIGTSTGPPAASAADMLGAPVGSTPTIRTPGIRLRSQVAQPEISPPPPTGTITTSGRHWSVSSTATLPCPVIVRGSSKGCT